MYRKYYSYSDMPVPITPQNKSEKSEKTEKRDNIHTFDDNSNCKKNVLNNDNNCSAPKKENECENKACCHEEVNIKNESEACCMNDSICAKHKTNTIGTFLGNIAVDDLILIAVILALLIDDCDDKLLIGAIIFIFLNM